MELKSITLALFMIATTAISFGQTTYTGIFRTPADNTTYHQFNRNGTGAAVYINQLNTQHSILRLSSGTATANQNVVFTVENDGSVGIGTTSPTDKLSVNGRIRAREVKVETSNWPDYVFGQDYRLTPLAEVEAYIHANGRLPGMPTAQQAEVEGIDLGEMNRMLLEKVEELTLHLIEKEKRENEMCQLMNAMEKRLSQLENPK